MLVKKHGLNERQATALGFVLKKGELHLRDYEQLVPDVERRTLQRDLKVLLEEGVLEEQGAGTTDPNRSYILLEKGR